MEFSRQKQLCHFSCLSLQPLLRGSPLLLEGSAWGQVPQSKQTSCWGNITGPGILWPVSPWLFERQRGGSLKVEHPLSSLRCEQAVECALFQLSWPCKCSQLDYRRWLHGFGYRLSPGPSWSHGCVGCGYNSSYREQKRLITALLP